MFSLIITIISIALVAVLALATLYYGGDAFNKGTAGAEASRLINEGQQVNGAVALANADSVAYTTITSLVTANYLAQAPASFAAATDVAATGEVEKTAVSDKVCIEVQKRAGQSFTGADSTHAAQLATAKQSGQVYGCYVDATVNTFFYNM